MEKVRGHHLKHGPILLQHGGAEEPESIVSVGHSPVDAWFYRRLAHSKPLRISGPDGKLVLESDATSLSSASMPQGPPYFPLGAPRLADYF